MEVNKLNKKIGIIGGGQLGKMMALAAKKMGLYIAVVDPAPDCPARSICDYYIESSFYDKQAIKKLCDISDVITYEFEHIDANTLIELENDGGKAIYPSPGSLKIIQDKYLQKIRLKESGIPVPEFMQVNSKDDMDKAGEIYGFPYLLKTRFGGYDGKGNYVIGSLSDIGKGWEALGAGNTPLMAEKFAAFAMEVSVIACRGIDGETKVYPVGRNTHIDNILDETYVPAPLDTRCIESAKIIADKVMQAFSGVGIFCVEMFIMDNGGVLVNEVAPRPHNSGHYTIEACVTSQFENHIRAVLGLPLGDPSLIRPAVMRNLLGGPESTGKAVLFGYDEALKIPGAFLHVYGKSVTKPYRKMGHVTVTAQTVEEAAFLCLKAQSALKFKAYNE